MKSMQYTIRGIPPALDRALRARARKTGKSLNKTALDALSYNTTLNEKKKTVHHDLDWFIGKKRLDKSFDEAMKWHDSLPNQMFDD
jgi:hypothetical protein